jgi:hypothetical protein
VGHGYAPTAAEARLAKPANLCGLQLFAVRRQLPFEPVAPSRKRSVRQGGSRQMSETGIMWQLTRGDSGARASSAVRAPIG